MLKNNDASGNLVLIHISILASPYAEDLGGCKLLMPPSCLLSQPAVDKLGTVTDLQPRRWLTTQIYFENVNKIRMLNTVMWTVLASLFYILSHHFLAYIEKDARINVNRLITGIEAGGMGGLPLPKFINYQFILEFISKYQGNWVLKQ